MTPIFRLLAHFLLLLSGSLASGQDLNQSTEFQLPNEQVWPSSINASSAPSNSVYEISDCGWRAKRLDDLLKKIPSVVAATLADIKLGVKSEHGFTALFKTNDNIAYITGLLNSVAQGSKRRGLAPSPKLWEAPQFICAAPYTRQKYPWMLADPWILCSGPAPFAPYYGMWIDDTNAIILCPDFWNFQPVPTQSRCPKLVKNKWADSPAARAESVYGFQIYNLIHEMLHFYMDRQSLSSHTRPREQYEINELVNLWAANTVRNPTNFQCYMALIQQKCTGQPDPFLPPFNQHPAGENSDSSDNLPLSNTSDTALDAVIPNNSSSTTGNSTGTQVPQDEVIRVSPFSVAGSYPERVVPGAFSLPESSK